MFTLHDIFRACTSAGKVELCCLASFLCCLMGSFDSFPLAVNLAITLLGLMACRSKSEAQYLAMVAFCGISAITDVVWICNESTGWGSCMVVINLVPKLSAANYTFRLSRVLADDDLENIGQSAEVQLVVEDYQALATEAYEKHSAMDAGSSGEHSTRYRAI